MIEQLKLAGIVLLIGLAVVLLAVCAHGGDYTVTRGTTIESERPIGLLVLEAGVGAINGARLWKGDEASSKQKIQTLVSGGQNVSTALHIDGSPAPGIGGVASAAWRLVCFVIWDEAGTIERTTTATVNRHYVVIRDRVENGRVWVQVVVGPPLGDPRVRCAVLELTGMENGRLPLFAVERWLRTLAGLGGAREARSPTRITIACSAIIDLPFDARRERVHARRQRWGCDRPTLSEGIAQREAGAETAATIRQLESVGREAVASGQDRLTAIVNQFLRRKCP